MTRRANAYVLALLGVSAGALSVPAFGSAATGGVGIGGSSTKRSQASGTAGVVQPGNVTVTASGNGITLTSRASAFLRNQLRFTGMIPASDAGDTVEIERLGHQTGWAWAPAARSRARSDGSFAVVWHVNHIGRFAIRALILTGHSSHVAAASPTLIVTVYRQTIATQFGPGFYGQTTACGEVLRRRTLGVANRTLPCGTMVAIYYQGRTIVVPVIDRGPYANHADYDLTEATGRALGMDGTATIGAVSLPRRPHPG